MVYFKISLFVTIATTVITSAFEPTLPYFPIEVSRCAVANPTTLWIFRVGALVSSILLCAERGLSDHWLPSLGLLMLAWFDDVSAYKLHVAGVVVMMLGAAPLVSWKIMACAAMVFGIRIVMKTVMVLPPLSELHTLNIPVLFDSVRQVMLRGHVSFDVVSIGRVTGVMQWIVFYVIMNSL